MNKQHEEKVFHFDGLAGRGNIHKANEWLTQLCKVIGEGGLRMNYTQLISDVLMVGTPVKPEHMPFVEAAEPNVGSLHRVIAYAKGQKSMPSSQKDIVVKMLQSIDNIERNNVNPYHYELAMCINGLLKTFELEGIQIVDDNALRNSIEDVVNIHKPSEEE